MINTATVARTFRLADVLEGLHVDLQPVVDLATGTPLAFEALARFATLREVPVDLVFAEAHAAGFGDELEVACLHAALDVRPTLPDGTRLAVNLGPDVLLHPAVRRAWPADLDGVIVEVTEYRASRPAHLHRELAALRRRGAALAVDDVGTGYAGLLRLATMQPDYVKVDRSVVAGVGRSATQAAVLDALVTFSHRTGSAVIAEGVETFGDLVPLAESDVDYVQGFAVGRPGPTPGAGDPLVVAACRRARSGVLQHRGAPRVGRLGGPAFPVAISAMASAPDLVELHAAIAQAADEFGIDCMGVSVVDADDGTLREVSSSGAPLDTEPYDLSEYPATRAVLDAGRIVEVHVADAGADPAERELLRAHGRASLLMVPLLAGDRSVGVLEMSSRSHRRWTTYDVALGRGLAAHVSTALLRITG